MELDAVPEDIRGAFEQSIEQDGQQIPYHQHPFFKEAKDWNSFASGALAAHREVGARIPIRVERTRNEQGQFIPKQESVDAWRKDHLPKLYDAGVLTPPPATPDVYTFNTPEGMPEGFIFNDDLAKEFRGILHKHGVPVAAAQELINLQNKALGHSVETFKTDEAKTMAALRAEHGDQFEYRQEMAKRMMPMIFRTPEDLTLAENLGIADHQGFLSLIMRLAPLAQQDSSFMREMKSSGGAGTMKPEEVLAEVAKISSDPKHDMHKGYWANDPKVMEHITSLYAKLPGANNKVNVSEGISVQAAPSR